MKINDPLLFLKVPQISYFEGGDEPGQEPGQGDSPKSFTQEDFDKFQAEQVAKNQELVEELETLQTSAKLTATERDTLKGRIDSLRRESMSKEELLKAEKEETEQKYQKRIQELEGSEKKWEKTFKTSFKQAEILKAAEGAYNPTQVYTMIKDSSEVVDVLDEDEKPTGTYKTVVNFDTQDKEGKPITLQLSPSEAVKKMKDMPDMYGNLFVQKGKNGFGNTNSSGGKTVSSSELAKTDPQKYRELRRQGKLNV